MCPHSVVQMPEVKCPPTNRDGSSRPTDRPFSAAEQAAAMPPGVAPYTMRSNEGVVFIPEFHISNGREKRAPHAYICCDPGAGKGTRLWKSGGEGSLGRHAATWKTYWVIRADKSIPYFQKKSFLQ